MGRYNAAASDENKYLKVCKTYFWKNYKIIVLIFILLMAFKYKPLILLLIFEIADFFKNVVMCAFPYIPLDLVFVFGITAAYFFNPWIAIIIFFLGLLNRMILARLEFRHIIKAFRHIFLFFLVVFFRHLDFFVAATLMLVLNYIMKYGFNIARDPVTVFEKTLFHVMNFIGASLLFYIIDALSYYISFLA